VYETSSVAIAVASLNAAVRGAMEQAIPHGYSCKSKFSHRFSYTLRYYIAKKNYFHRRFKKNSSDFFYDRFAYYRKLVKNTIKSYRLRWLKWCFRGVEHHNYTKCSTSRKHNAIRLETTPQQAPLHSTETQRNKARNYAITSTSSFHEKIPQHTNQQFKFLINTFYKLFF
jgi:hypothetical protein